MKVQDLANAKVMPFVEYKGDTYYLLEDEEEQEDGTWKAWAVRADDTIEADTEDDTSAWAPRYDIYFVRRFVPDEYDSPWEYAEVICVDASGHDYRLDI